MPQVDDLQLRLLAFLKNYCNNARDSSWESWIPAYRPDYGRSTASYIGTLLYRADNGFHTNILALFAQKRLSLNGNAAD